MDAAAKKSKNETTVVRQSDLDLVLTRQFDAPAKIIFEAWTKPELLRRWWAPRSLGVTLMECEADVRVGGTYRYVFGRNPKEAMAFTGEYKEVVPYTKLVHTQIFEQMRQAGAALVTITFEENAGKTKLTVHAKYASKEALDGAVASGMERGMRETMDQLEDLATEP